MTEESTKGLTREAQEALQQFLRGYDGLRSEVKSIALNILVWGPSPTSDSLEAKKRKALKDALTEDGHNAMFSEDLPSPELAIHHEEALQAKLADAIVVLYTSFGPIAEVHDFGDVPEIARKMLIWVPEIARNGYGSLGLLKQLGEVGPAAVRYFSSKDLEDCIVVKHTVEHMRERRWHKFVRGAS